MSTFQLKKKFRCWAAPFSTRNVNCETSRNCRMKSFKVMPSCSSIGKEETDGSCAQFNQNNFEFQFVSQKRQQLLKSNQKDGQSRRNSAYVVLRHIQVMPASIEHFSLPETNDDCRVKLLFHELSDQLAQLSFAIRRRFSLGLEFFGIFEY
ncbi:hypothetical protein OUZ56_015622 [Daphnia magna]|uniref:Uncharacterized protein n=1 Tax=Daphnia magna TaxID=35525 RepID=A0ABR0ANJ9_9CRUS|nr:hypothetical protein OUZ56_015622 [Daphnia magna]